MNGSGPLDDLQLERLREAFAADSGRPAPGSCPPPERVWEAARGRGSADTIRTVLDHLAECPDCSGEWRLAVAFEKEQVPAALSRTPRPHPHLRSWAAAAAVVAVAFGVAGVWWSQRGFDEAPAIYREAPAEAEGERIESLVPESGALPRDAPVLRWTSGPKGSTYDLLVSTEDLSPLADAAGLSEPRYRLPAEAVDELPSGAAILWRVEAITPEGRRITSRTVVTRLE